ncbi:lasso peptide biosynthesis B2 protein [Nocardia arthritidis]|uniref:Lasso peptide biosynthesis B2 protein n=1 Tax=Nocardia arthritidis TaxID=228602 RepID=A0A6G9YB64_9NOCA|nr:lasso peptide biosynthesis B2 protein [Nocardia arthritidis]QIS10461.1 lasso peptide biosynthesis B2 protein [Nocardia arthritidis]
MTYQGVLELPTARVRLVHGVVARFIIVVATVLTYLPPYRIRQILMVVRRGAHPASHESAVAARNAVVAVSMRCAGRDGCLVRSLSTVLLCRFFGQWPTWCIGVQNLPPFGAHAWVEAEGKLVNELVPYDYLSRLIVVPPIEQ